MLKHLSNKLTMTEKLNQLFLRCEGLCKDMSINKKHVSHEHKGKESKLNFLINYIFSLRKKMY